MPSPRWAHECACGRGFVGQAECPTCGRPGKFVGHGNSVVEHWCAFNRVTGLNPLGDKSSPEARAIMARVVACGLCDRSGFVSSSPESWGDCPRCLGDGSALDGRFRGAEEGGES